MCWYDLSITHICVAPFVIYNTRIPFVIKIYTFAKAKIAFGNALLPNNKIVHPAPKRLLSTATIIVALLCSRYDGILAPTDIKIPFIEKLTIFVSRSSLSITIIRRIRLKCTWIRRDFLPNHLIQRERKLWRNCILTYGCFLSNCKLPNINDNRIVIACIDQFSTRFPKAKRPSPETTTSSKVGCYFYTKGTLPTYPRNNKSWQQYQKVDMLYLEWFVSRLDPRNPFEWRFMLSRPIRLTFCWGYVVAMLFKICARPDRPCCARNILLDSAD